MVPDGSCDWSRVERSTAPVGHPHMTRLHGAGVGRRDRAIPQPHGDLPGRQPFHRLRDAARAGMERTGWPRGTKGGINIGGINIYTPYYFNSSRRRIDFEVFPLKSGRDIAIRLLGRVVHSVGSRRCRVRVLENFQFAAAGARTSCAYSNHLGPSLTRLAAASPIDPRRI